jgi:hypothetical protein
LRQQLREFEEVGIDQVVCLSQAGKITHDMLCSSIELFTKDVMPEFRDRDQRCARQQAERRARLSDIALARRPKTEGPKGPTIIRAAGHH